MQLAWSEAGMDVAISVYNQAGELVANLGKQTGGRASWDPQGRPRGIYVVAFMIEGERHRKLVKVALLP